MATGEATETLAPDADSIERFVNRNSVHIRQAHGLVEPGSPCFTRASAFLDGMDVSRECFAANDVECWVDCYRQPLTVHGDHLASYRRWGHVVIECALHPAGDERVGFVAPYENRPIGGSRESTTS